MQDQRNVISAPHVKWEPLPARSSWAWPGGARLAVSFLFHVEFVPLTPPGARRDVPASLVHRGPYPRYSDVHEVTPHEYGNRVGLFRLMNMFDEHGFTASAAVDTVIAESYPSVVEAISRRGWSVLGHGRHGGEIQSELLSESQEREAITANITALRRAFDRDIRGWAGVEYAESSRTPDLLRESGLDYLCGRPNDEQPYPLGDDFTCLPVAIHLDDVFAGRLRKVTAAEHADSIVRAIDVMTAEDDPASRHLVIGLHPWYSGQPFRAKQIARVLSRLQGDPRIWVADTDAIVDSYRTIKEDAK